VNEIYFPIWDPVALQVGPIAFRWYGLSYVAGYILLYLTARYLVRAGYLKADPHNLDNLIYWIAGMTLLGGRLGEAVFYNHSLLNPLLFVQIWEGGLSFHGAILGAVSGYYIWAKRNGVDFFRVADTVALGGAPGIFLGRFANFVNGELYGRITDASVPWAMRFPTDPVVADLLGFKGGLGLRERELLIQEAHRIGAWEQVRHLVPLRHPSQLYEALGEGLFLAICLWLMWALTRKRPLNGGLLASAYVPAYGIVRFVIEFYREPEPQFVTLDNPNGAVLLGMTMGQALCVLMIIVGTGLVVWRWRADWVEKMPATTDLVDTPRA
jgi:phosphatidylglycerol---prolipoprotein diacylglyceryl transferase